MRKNSLEYFVGALLRPKHLTISAARNVQRAVRAVDAGLCRFTQGVTGHRVRDKNWNVDFGIELTEAGQRLAKG